MKATGIVRKIDDLGRVVIPKEIRRTLKIRESDPLEIFTEKDGSMIFKKYSPMGDMQETAAQLCDAVYAVTGKPVAVSDRDSVIAAAGVHGRELLDKQNSEALDRIIAGREPYSHASESPALPLLDGADRFHITAAVPILNQGDLMGCISLLGQEQTEPPKDSELLLLLTLSEFLGKQVEP